MDSLSDKGPIGIQPSCFTILLVILTQIRLQLGSPRANIYNGDNHPMWFGFQRWPEWWIYGAAPLTVRIHIYIHTHGSGVFVLLSSPLSVVAYFNSWQKLWKYFHVLRRFRYLWDANANLWSLAQSWLNIYYHWILVLLRPFSMFFFSWIYIIIVAVVCEYSFIR